MFLPPAWLLLGWRLLTLCRPSFLRLSISSCRVGKELTQAGIFWQRCPRCAAIRAIMQDSPFVLGFTAGELSPWLSNRFDLQAYQRGAAKLQNFLVQPYGGVRRRCGSEYVGAAAVQEGDAVKLVPFSFSAEDALMLEFYPGGMRVYKEGALLQNEDGTAYVLATPWDSADEVMALRCTQVNDVVYVTSPFRQPYTLSRYGNTNWVCEELLLNPYPRETYLEQRPALNVYVESNGLYVTLETDSTAPEFTPEMANSEYVLAEVEMPSRTFFLNESFSFTSTAVPDLSSNVVFGSKVYHVYHSDSLMYDYYYCYRVYTSDSYSGKQSPLYYPKNFIPGVMRLNEDNTPYEVCGDWELYTNGEWNAQWELWRSYDDYSVDLNFYRWRWARIRSFEQNNYSERKNWALSGSESSPCRMVLVCRSASGSSLGAHVYFRMLGGPREYKFEIVSYISPHKVRALISSTYLDTCRSFYTRTWSFGAFGSRNGYPAFSGLHQGRLWFGGTAGLPTTLFASTVGDFNNFRVGSNDDDALHLTLATDDQSRICWICPARNLLVGTTESEWTLSSPDGGVMTPSNAAFARQSSVGSEVKEASGVENTVFYVQRGGKRLREISYKLEADGFTSTDTSLLAEHLFASGVREWVVQRGSSARVWALMNDYSVAVLTTNVEQQVTAWQRISFPGRKVLHMASLPRMGSNEDELWLIVRHESNGFLSIERIVSEQVFLDGFCRVTPSSSQVQAPLHVAGLEGFVYPEDEPGQAQAVTFGEDGSFEIDGWEEGRSYCYGIAYLSELETMPLENERTFNAVRQEGRVKLRLLESNPAFSYRSSQAEQWEEYDPSQEWRSYPFSGAVRVPQIPAPATGQGFCLRVGGTLDFQLLSMTVEFDFHGH